MLKVWAIQVEGEVVSTTKEVVAKAWRAAGLEVVEMAAAAAAAAPQAVQESRVIPRGVKVAPIGHPAKAEIVWECIGQSRPNTHVSGWRIDGANLVRGANTGVLIGLANMLLDEAENQGHSFAATQQGLDAQNPQNAVLDISTRPTVQIHWSREGDPLVMLHSVGVEMDGSCTTAGMLEAVAAAINDYAKQARKKYGGGIPLDTMSFVNVSMRSRDGDGDGASIDGHSVIQTSNKPPHGVTINHPAHIAAQAKQGGAA